jgi:6-phosphogluconolactonase
MNISAWRRVFGAVFVGGVVYLAGMPAKTIGAETLVYFGTYSGAKSKGIYLSRFDEATGKLTAPELAATTKNPSFLAVHPNGRFLYAVGELSGATGLRAGAVAAFRIDPKSGQLTPINRQPSGGGGPCHLSVDPTGKCILTANYGSGGVGLLPIKDDGSVGAPCVAIQHHGSSVNPQRQAGPHAHFITPDPANRFALACDLGLDQVLVYKFDPAQCTLVANEPPAASIQPGSGPRHVVFHPKGRFVYLISEISSTITALTYDEKLGVLKEFQTVSTLPADFKGSSSGAEIQIHPSGKFLYGSNRGHDSIAVFAIEAKSGKLTCLGYESTGGKIPRHFTFDPSGKWVVAENQDSNDVVVFKADAKTGRLTLTSERIEVGTPVCAVFVKPGR